VIIKKRTRHNASFGQLISYMEQGRGGNDSFLFAHNISSSFGDPKGIAKEFRTNSKLMKQRKEQYSLSNQSLIQMKELEVPDSLCSRLEPMKGKKYSSRQELTKNAHDLLGDSYHKHRFSIQKSLHITGKNLYLYHDIISFKEEKELFLKHPEIFQKTFQKWVDVRYKKSLVYGVAHLKDEDKPHIHIMASANGLGEQKKLHFNKKEFKSQFLEMQQLHEELQQEFPELSQSKTFHQVKQTSYTEQQQREKRANTQLHQQKKQPQHKPTRNKKISQELQKIIQSSQSLDVMKQRMERQGYTLYSRGSTYGVQKANGRKYRLKTLGLAEEFTERTQQISERELNKQRMQQQSEAFRQAREREQEKEREEALKQKITEPLDMESLTPREQKKAQMKRSSQLLSQRRSRDQGRSRDR